MSQKKIKKDYYKIIDRNESQWRKYLCLPPMTLRWQNS
jgi:hypothetical protein